MRHKYFLFESLSLALIAISLDLYVNRPIETILINAILSLILISLNTIISKTNLLLILNVMAMVLLLLIPSTGYHVMLLAYLFTHLIQHWTLLLFFIIIFIEPLSLLQSIFIGVAIYIAYKSQSQHITNKELVKIRDDLQEEQLRIKSQQQALIHSKQKDIDIAILMERNRISQDLHDAVGHSLARSIIQIDAMKIMNDNDKIDQQLEQLQTNLRDGMNNIRDTIHQVHHESLDLHTSVRELQNELAPLHITFDQLSHYRFTYNQKMDLLSIIKEAIYNSVKHSNATEVNIVLQSFPQHIKLMIKDNGTNYESQSEAEEGIGQTMMRQIAQKYKGKLLLHYQNGYIVNLNIPITSL